MVSYTYYLSVKLFVVFSDAQKLVQQVLKSSNAFLMWQDSFRGSPSRMH